MQFLSRHSVTDFTKLLSDRADRIIGSMQPGILYPAPHMAAVTLFIEDDTAAKISRSMLGKISDSMRETVHARCSKRHGSVTLGVSFPMWKRLCDQDEIEPPVGMRFHNPSKDDTLLPTVLENSPALRLSIDDLPSVWFLLKADDPQAIDLLEQGLHETLEEVGISGKSIVVKTRNPAPDAEDPSGNRVIGGRYHESLRNPVSPVEMLEHIVVGQEDTNGGGGSFVFTQRFLFNWDELHAKSPSEIDSVIGRQAHTDELMISADTHSHIKASHTNDEDGHTIKVLRLGFPFGTDEGDSSNSIIAGAGGATARDEKGVYFIALARNAGRIERILESQRGSDGLFTRDRLLSGSLALSDLGGFFYIPSITELDSSRFKDDLEKRAARGSFCDWTRFPGMDWTRLVRHYRERSTNGLMFYNHRDYLYEMGTASGSRADELEPPSLRVQFLLERLFSRWDDTWYNPQKPDELLPLADYLVKFFEDNSNAGERNSLVGNGSADDAVAKVMKRAVVVRSAWATRIMVGHLAVDPDGIGSRVNGGMDLCDIHPLDLLAGSMSGQSLGEGKYVVNYCQDEAEERKWFNLGLSPTSGVGHVVPGYEELLENGIVGLEKKSESESKNLASDSESAERAEQLNDFFVAQNLTLLGFREHLLGLAKCVTRRKKKLALGSELEEESLEALEERLQHLGAGNPPRTMLEATQLVFSAHACLHIIGEPVAVGRLDRLLAKFQEEDIKEGRITPEGAQEIIDAFWIKLGEKVLLNRIFIDDRQQLGNLAMGNRAGAYPKGQSANHWIQQLTVGGLEADSTWAYSDVSMYCLKAARRLPFNAPVLSLRVGRDMPDEWRLKLLEEAARGMLSGGASPILLNDDKIVPALLQSGSGIGPSQSSNAKEFWNSEVRLEDAYDYACDGCYEPQFCGANWFTLGGMQTLLALECALNEGRQMISAGPVHLLGKTSSFRSPPPTKIETLDELLELFYQHLGWLYSKQVVGTLASFGRMEAVCPAPLLNHFIDDCVSKGRDIYAGGARYNVLGPCFTTLANTINSLWAIKTMCFDTNTSVTSLPELVSCLLSNWGETPIDPLVHPTMLQSGNARLDDVCERFKHLREVALSLPRWGRGEPDIDGFGNEICMRVAEIAMDVVRKPTEDIANQMESLAGRFGTKTQPFGGISMQPGVGTFASYVEQGLGCGASADGRLHGQPVATDLSPSPIPLDIPIEIANAQESSLSKVLASIAHDDSFGFTNGSPFDVNIREDFDLKRLVEVLQEFANGAGTNILTVTTADRETFIRAARSPEAFDLLRVRMGGWTEMFVAMHAAHQGVHPRRPVSV